MRNESRLMDKPRQVINLTEQEAKTYLHLGIIASSAGTRDSIYKKKETIVREGGLPENNVDLISWFAEQFPEEELARMWEFRGRLVHGVCLVNPDGELTIFDKGGIKHVYSAGDVQHMAALFWGVHFSNRVSVTMSVEEQ